MRECWNDDFFATFSVKVVFALCLSFFAHCSQLIEIILGKAIRKKSSFYQSCCPSKSKFILSYVNIGHTVTVGPISIP